MKQNLKKFRLFFTEANISMVLGLVIVFCVVYLLVGYFKSVKNSGQLVPAVSTAIEEIETRKDNAVYTVQSGDTLWGIAEKEYRNGFDWTRIYEANKVVIGSDPWVLEKGVDLIIPQRSVPSPVEYTVVPGDSLWKISQTICFDGYQWPQVAKDNKIPNPSLIYPNLKLTITCK
jgi:nucleoid-associated protein YgaU